jgi:hypothetical protein
MSLFKTPVRRLMKFDAFPEIREMRILCRKILKYKKARQFLFENVKTRFNPKTHEDYAKIIEMLKYWLNREETSYKRYARRIVLHMQERADFRIEDINKKGGDSMFNCNFNGDLPYDKYYSYFYTKRYS